MHVLHHCLEHRYRHPFGARPCGDVVRLRLEVDATEGEVVRVYLHYAYGLKSFEQGCLYMSRLHPEQPLYTVDLPLPQERGLLFYWFELRLATGASKYYARRHMDELLGELYDHPPVVSPQLRSPCPFQITVYEQDFDTPDWQKGCVMYQIFPDRFARDQDFHPSRFVHAKEGSEYLFHHQWEEEVDFCGADERGYLACDFFGGSLKGIREKLDYLEDLGVELLYLNPIAQARSNHRYDTGDYLKVDPLLGTMDDFRKLCEEAGKRGIRIILDGVYSHTGADSLYFNREGRYPEVGAYQEMLGQGISPYRSWYDMEYREGKIAYESWWGFPDLPTLRKQDLNYQNFICGSDGVLAYWLRQGASGFRLDVSDELPDTFLRTLYQRVKTENPEAYVLGEIWEDASYKVSYGSFRDFCFGRTHDGAMGYPLAHSIHAFIAGEISAEHLAKQVHLLLLNYPWPFLYSSMNLIGSHDIVRPMTRLLRLQDPGTREEQQKIQLSTAQREEGKTLVILAYLLAFFLPGAPCIYYGDEQGMEGFRDPFNRRTFPWEQRDERMEASFRSLGQLRKKETVLKRGWLRILHAEGDHLILLRYFRLGRDAFGQEAKGNPLALLFLNRSKEEWQLSTEEKRLLQAYPIEAPERINGQSGEILIGQHRYHWGSSADVVK